MGNLTEKEFDKLCVEIERDSHRPVYINIPIRDDFVYIDVCDISIPDNVLYIQQQIAIDYPNTKGVWWVPGDII